MAEPNFLYNPEDNEDLELDIERCEADRSYSLLKREGREPGKLIVPKNWDIRKNDISLLKIGGISLSPLEDVYYGIHNLFVPSEILDLENPSEIIANYLGAGILKKHNAQLVNGDIPKGSFSDLVQYMNSVAYNNPIFAKYSHESKNRFPATSGFQKKRLSHLTGDVKRRFCKSFFSKYRASNREEPNNPEAFLDPLNWNKYVEGIYQHFKRRFASR